MKEKCLVIMPMNEYKKYPEKHFEYVYKQIIKPAVEDAGYEPYRVDDDKISTAIIVKIFKDIQDCPMAVCDLSNQNPNVLYELGLMHAYNKRVVLIQDDKTEKIFDVSGINTIKYRSERLYENVEEDRKKLQEAIEATKNGEVYSIAKIAGVESVTISSEKTGSDETMRMKDIQETKEDKRGKNLLIEKNVDKESEISLSRLPQKSDYEGVVKVKLKPELTEGEKLDKTIGELENVEGVYNWKIDKDKNLVVYIKKGYVTTHLKSICNKLEKLGSISYKIC